jgi:transposase InsO family protein
LVITAVVVEGRSQAEVARAYNVSPSWVSKLVARYRSEGDTAFEPRPRRPKTSPGALPAATVELIVKLRTELTTAGHDAGAHTIGWHLRTQHGITISAATIWRTLSRAGLITPQPKKRPRASYIRFEADQPNECWQTDFTHWRLADDTDVEILTFLDDHSRFVLACHAAAPVTSAVVLAVFRAAIAAHGAPASTLSDNGLVFTARYRKGRAAFEHELRALGIQQKNGHPNHPQTQGKVERYQQTLKRWLTHQPLASDLGELQQQIDTFVAYYNTQRPHRSLNGRTPTAAYQARPKAGPAGTNTGPHDRIRRDRVDSDGKLTIRHNGKLHHIGIGRTHARTPVIMLIQDLDIHIINADTGELLRELTLDITRDYQPSGKDRYAKWRH